MGALSYLPADLSALHAVAIAWLFACWMLYSPLLRAFAQGSISVKLGVVRERWMCLATERGNKTQDAMLLGHIVHSVAFFGSATLLVLAGVLGTLLNLAEWHRAVVQLPFAANASVALFAVDLGVVAVILAVSFFLFTYSLRKLIYLVALMGALPDRAAGHPKHGVLVVAVASVLTEAVKSFNAGIRGYYYATAALFLFVDPLLCIVATAAVSAILLYRQMVTPTSRAVQTYVDALTADSGDALAPGRSID